MECEEEAPKRQLLRWSKPETLVLLHAKQKLSTLNSSSINNNPELHDEEHQSDLNKWRRVSHLLRSQGFDRDQVACKKRWFHLLSDFRKIHDWEAQSAQSQPQSSSSFWLLQPQERRDNRLPSGFDRDLYTELEAWLKLGSSSSSSAPAAANTGEPSSILTSTQPDPEDEHLLGSSPEVKLSSRKKQKHNQQTREPPEAPEADHLEVTLRRMIEAQKEINRSQVEALKQIAAVQAQQGKEMIQALHSIASAVGELAKSQHEKRKKITH